MKASLVVLAAGMGSRYGGLKQLDSFGPCGETIIDYSIYDAIRAGFVKVVFVIRESFKEDFIEFFTSKFEDKIEVEFVVQELDRVPEGFDVPDSRKKPWGTGHAVLMAKDVVHEPFAVINGDDFYGRESYESLMSFFKGLEGCEDNYSVVGYYLKNTLSDHGHVNRGVCYANDEGHLTKVVECTKIKREEDDIIRYPDASGEMTKLDDDVLVSMNMWGFTPSYFNQGEELFSQFLIDRGNEEKSEFYIPYLVDHLINEDKVNVEVLKCDASWFGVTYQEDKPIVVRKLIDLIADGVYPSDLWGE